MLPLFAMLSEWHIILALIIVFLLFGGKKLPELARGLGEAIREFTKGKRDITNDMSQSGPTPPVIPPPVTTEPPAKPPQTPSVPQKPGDPNLN